MQTVFEQAQKVMEDKVQTHKRTVAFEQYLGRTYGITVPQLGVLLYVETGGDDVKLGDIADALGMGRANMTGISDRLVRDGYLTRRESTKDRRVRVLEFTTKGLDLMNRIKTDVMGGGECGTAA